MCTYTYPYPYIILLSIGVEFKLLTKIILKKRQFAELTVKKKNIYTKVQIKLNIIISTNKKS